MIQNPLAIVAILLLIETLILYLANHARYSKFFSVLPSVFWIYFVPMIVSSCGLIDSKSAIYGTITTYVLPIALFLLLMTVDLKAIFRLGPKALIMFFIGSIGIMIGMTVVFALFKSAVGSQFAPGFAALSASWTGGSANMIAVKEALNVPENVFLPMVIVDTIVPYVWMALMIACVGFSPLIDRLNNCDRSVLDDLNQRIENVSTVIIEKLTLTRVAGLVVLGAIGGFLSIWLSRLLPEIPGVISTYAWGIMIVTILGVACSFTPAQKLQQYGSNKVGYFLLYFVLTSIGARASISHIDSSLILIAAGFLVILIHGAILLAAARILRVPIFLAVVASQANVGGVASAPIVAEIYQKGFASVGLLLAILGNIEGTLIGIIMGQILH